MALKFGTITYQHAEWLSKNRMADPVTGCDSDGYLFGALTGGFHANFDGSYMEVVADDTGLLLPVVAKSYLTGNAGGTASEYLDASSAGTIALGSAAGPKMLANAAAVGALFTSTASDPSWALAAVAKGRMLVSDGAATIPKYATAASSTAAGAIPLFGSGVDIAYLEPVAAGRFIVSVAANTAPKFLAAAGTNNSFMLCNTGADATYLAPGTANQVLRGVGAATSPAWTTVDFSGTTGTAGTVGQVAITNMTATGAVVVTALENLGTGIVISDVICGVGLITVYTKDINSIAPADGRTALDAKKVAVHVIKLS